MTNAEINALRIYLEDRRRRESEIVFSSQWWLEFCLSWFAALLTAAGLVLLAQIGVCVWRIL